MIFFNDNMDIYHKMNIRISHWVIYKNNNDNNDNDNSGSDYKNEYDNNDSNNDNDNL